MAVQIFCWILVSANPIIPAHFTEMAHSPQTTNPSDEQPYLPREPEAIIYGRDSPTPNEPPSKAGRLNP